MKSTHHFHDIDSDTVSGVWNILNVSSPEAELDTDVRNAFDKQWSVIVWNDPVNLMQYVVRVFQQVLHMNKEQATRHMLEVHHQGKSLVAQETKERAEHHVHELQKYGLQATLQPL